MPIHRLLSPNRLRLLLLAATLAGLCSSSSRAYAGKCPNLVIVLDRSGSMTSAPDGGSAPPGGSRWELAVKAIKQVVDTYDGQLPIGLSMFAPDGSCGAGRLDVPPDYETKDKIKIAVDTATPNSSTPTSETIISLSREKALQDPLRAQYLMLLTDGEPNCSSGEPTTTVNALNAARMQSPPISTFVIGFGSLPASAAQAMDDMAVAGGLPVVGKPRKYFAAEDFKTLQEALEQIFKIIVGELGSSCDDTCYARDVGCPTPGDMCIRAKCQPNPCASVSCGPGLYCHTDGVQAGRCVAPCKKACPNGTRCSLGSCIATVCPAACSAGFVCNPSSKLCEPDPLCPADRPRQQQCRTPSQCQFGTCVDDPCVFIKCPTGSRCVPWDGSCEWAPRPATADMGPGLDEDDEDTRPRSSGCQLGPSSAPSGFLLAGGLMLVALLTQRRRQRR